MLQMGMLLLVLVLMVSGILYSAGTKREQEPPEQMMEKNTAA